MGDLALAPESRELAHAVLEAHVRVGGVELVDADAVDAEGDEARLAGLAQVLGPGVARPGSAGPLEASLRGHDDRGRRLLAQGPRDEALVVSDVAVVEAVDVGGVDQGDAGVERRVDRADPLVLAGRPWIDMYMPPSPTAPTEGPLVPSVLVFMGGG